MKTIKEVLLFIVVCYIACFLTLSIRHGFRFNTDYLIDATFITFGAIIGSFIGRGIAASIKNKKEKNKNK